MTLQDHNTINELIKFYLKETGDRENDKINKLLIHNAIMGRELDLNIYESKTKQMRTPEQIIQAYAMGLLMPGEVVSQMKDHYPGLSPVQIMNTINTILT